GVAAVRGTPLRPPRAGAMPGRQDPAVRPHGAARRATAAFAGPGAEGATWLVVLRRLRREPCARLPRGVGVPRCCLRRTQRVSTRERAHARTFADARAIHAEDAQTALARRDVRQAARGHRTAWRAENLAQGQLRAGQATGHRTGIAGRTARLFHAGCPP